VLQDQGLAALDGRMTDAQRTAKDLEGTEGLQENTKKENLLSGHLRPCQYLKQAISLVLQYYSAANIPTCLVAGWMIFLRWKPPVLLHQ
jgi:hypothetical protein